MVLPAHSHAGRHWPASPDAMVASGLALPKLTGRQRQEILARPRTLNRERRSSENPISTIKNFVCKYLC